MICDKCGYFTSEKHERTYGEREVCVPCLVDLKLANGDYS